VQDLRRDETNSSISQKKFLETRLAATNKRKRQRRDDYVCLNETAALAQKLGGHLRKEKAVSPDPVQKKDEKIPPTRALNEKKKHKPPARNFIKKNYHLSIVGAEQSNVGESPCFANVVLTVGHCYTSGGYFVNANALVEAYEMQPETCGAKFVNNAAQKNHHPECNGFAFANDFTLLKLSEEVNSVAPVTLSLNGYCSIPRRLRRPGNCLSSRGVTERLNVDRSRK
jgi:hypothetical protein